MVVTTFNDRLHQAIQALQSQVDARPEVAIVLGSGLGPLADRIENAKAIPFREIPGFHAATAGGHRGELIFGSLARKNVVAMAGRLHRYEGHDNDTVSFPVRVMQGCGARVLVVSNAAGGVQPYLRVGDIVVIQNCVNWMRGPFRTLPSSSLERIDAPQRLADLLDAELSETALAAARRAQFAAYPGTYLAMLGPCYETRAEYRMLRRLGIDVVGMSTVPEVLMGRQLGMRILALSVVSNVASPDTAMSANHEEVLLAGRSASSKMEAIVRAVLQSL
jgi:purine-nucleoside phosphorylase